MHARRRMVRQLTGRAEPKRIFEINPGMRSSQRWPATRPRSGRRASAHDRSSMAKPWSRKAALLQTTSPHTSLLYRTLRASGQSLKAISAEIAHGGLARASSRATVIESHTAVSAIMDDQSQRLIETVRTSIIGDDQVLSGPYDRRVTYADYTASGRR